MACRPSALVAGKATAAHGLLAHGEQRHAGNKLNHNGGHDQWRPLGIFLFLLFGRTAGFAPDGDGLSYHC